MNWNKKSFLAIVAAILIVVAIGKFISIPSPLRKKSITVSPLKQIIEIEVRKGWCLSEIALDLGTDWLEIAKLNDLKNPDLIYPGQNLKVIPFNQNSIVKTSWYGQKFHGKLMANKKPFNMYDPTITAQKWLAFGTKIRLTCADTEKSIVVIVQDRGPYHEDRSFDLSWAAAKKLGIVDLGVVICKVEILN